jgi:DNA-binding transcriptional LysR family regulator
MRYRSTVGVANAVAAGIGIASLPSTFFEDPVLRERLVPVLTQCPLRETTLYAVYVSRKFVPLKIRSFVDFVLDRFKVPTPVSVIPQVGAPRLSALRGNG